MNYFYFYTVSFSFSTKTELMNVLKKLGLSKDEIKNGMQSKFDGYKHYGNKSYRKYVYEFIVDFVDVTGERNVDVVVSEIEEKCGYKPHVRYVCRD